MDFDKAFERLLGHEGGYTNDPRDPGGETKFGVSKRSYPGEDIASLTIERAKLISRRDFWGPAGCDGVPDAVKFDLFDAAYNSGVKQAIKFLQRAVGEAEDGILGPRTLQAAQSMNQYQVHARFNGARLDFLNDLPTWPTYGRGWAQRIATNLKD